MVYTNTLVNKEEKIVDKFEVGSTSVYYTDKRLYVVTSYGENTDEEVVERSQITGVHIKKSTPQEAKVSWISGLFMAIILAVAGLVINGFLVDAFPGDYPDGLFSGVFCTIGGIILVVNIVLALIKSKKKYNTTIEINATSHQISIPVPTTDDINYLATIRIKLFKLLNEQTTACNTEEPNIETANNEEPKA